MEQFTEGTRVRITNVGGNLESPFVGYEGTVMGADDVSNLFGWLKVDMDSYPPDQELMHTDFLLMGSDELEIIE